MRSLAILIFGFCMMLMWGCSDSSSTQKVLPDDYMNAEAQAAFKKEVIRYIGKLPGKANHVSKFDSIHNDYYNQLAENHHLKHYFVKADSGWHYFLITRIAPSLEEKYVAVGGRLKRDTVNNNIVFFEEIFRTWKMLPDEIDQTGKKLFVEMIQGKDLSRYYTENSGDEFIIEFPNKDVYYDTAQRIWISHLEDPLESLYKIQAQTERDRSGLTIYD